MYRLLRPLIFRLDPETAHHSSLTALRQAGNAAPARATLRRMYTFEDPRLATQVCGLHFDNPVGLAAGYDKDGKAIRGLCALGFGHLEIGTVTVQPQPGNPRPRIRRFAREQALVNSMGFPNAGVEALRLELMRADSPGRRARIGINLGKGKATPLERAAEDYCGLLRRLHGQADYFAINVSSPNTPELRKLQTRAYLSELLTTVTRTRDELQPRVPVFVKIAPDLDDAGLDDVLEAVSAAGIEGIIATNTTVERAGLPPEASELPGGVSGAPLFERSNEILRRIAQATAGGIALIGVGGIRSADDAWEKLRAGAHLVQIYTGLIYGGPGLVRAINRGLAARCEREGLTSIAQLRG